MYGGELALAVWFLVGALPSTEHSLVGMAPSVVFDIRPDGVELSSSLSDSLGVLVFTTPAVPDPGPATVEVREAGLPSPSLICGESPR
jgi:hypothetical protein